MTTAISYGLDRFVTEPLARRDPLPTECPAAAPLVAGTAFGPSPSALLARMPLLARELYADIATWPTLSGPRVAEALVLDGNVHACTHCLDRPAFDRVAARHLVSQPADNAAWVLRGWYAPALRGEPFAAVVSFRPSDEHVQEVVVAFAYHRIGELVAGVAPLVRAANGIEVSPEWRFLRAPGGVMHRRLREARRPRGRAGVGGRRWHYFEQPDSDDELCLYCGVPRGDALFGRLGCEGTVPLPGAAGAWPSTQEQRRLVGVDEKFRRALGQRAGLARPAPEDAPHAFNDWGVCVVCDRSRHTASPTCETVPAAALSLPGPA